MAQGLPDGLDRLILHSYTEPDSDFHESAVRCPLNPGLKLIHGVGIPPELMASLCCWMSLNILSRFVIS